MTWLFEGLGAAIIGGLVSAVTALTVVRLTSRADRRLEREREARDAAARVLTLGKTISTLTTDISGTFRGFSRSLVRERAVLLREFQVAAFVLHGALSATDEDLAILLQVYMAKKGAIDPDYVLDVCNFASQVISPELVVKGSYDAAP